MLLIMDNSIDEAEETRNCKELGTLIEALTHSGSNTLDEDTFKQIKKICKSSQIYVSKAYDLLLGQLKKKNSQIRFLAFQMCRELFQRSALFREHFVKDLELIYKLTAEINSKDKLPPPKPSAQNLKVFALKTLVAWVEEFGEVHKKLKIAYNYFKNCKQVNFETFAVTNSAEQIRQNENELRQRNINEQKLQKVIEDVKSYESEIQRTITSLSNCLNLLLPPPENFFIPENSSSVSFQSSIDEQSSSINFNSDKEEVNPSNLRPFGITTDYSLVLEYNPNDKIKVTKTEENSSILENAKDCAQLISCRFLPMIKNWSKAFNKYSSRNCDELKKILNIKEKLQKVLDKYNALVIKNENFVEKNIENSSDEEELEEVKKEGYEDTVEFSDEDLPVASPFKQNQKKLESVEKNISKSHLPSSLSTTVDSFKDSETTSSDCNNEKSESTITNRKSKLLKVAPKLPFDIDLYHWEDDVLTAPTLISSKMDVDKFWGCAGSDDIHEIPNPEGVAALRTRVIEFSGKFEPVKWSCRAPLPNGNLCPRKDRFKCPFHGKIVPRNEQGECVNPEDEKITQHSVPDWQNPELLAELKASTGIDLKMPERRSKKRKSTSDNLTHKKMKTSAAALKIAKAKNFPGLIDVVRKQNNSRTRLSKKIFNRSALKRVSKALNKLDKKKFHDKFGDCFNYS